MILASATLAMTTNTTNPPKRQQHTFDQNVMLTAKRLHGVSRYTDQVSFDQHLLYVATVKRWAGIVGLDDHWRMAVVLFYVESGYRTTVTDLDSVGISQVRARYRRDFAKHLPAGFLDGFDPWHYEHQIAIGMGALKQKLIESRLEGGGINGAVRLYNGRGKGGFNHLWKVKRDYKLIFGDEDEEVVDHSSGGVGNSRQRGAIPKPANNRKKG